MTNGNAPNDRPTLPPMTSALPTITASPIALLCCMVLLCASLAGAQAGSLDTSFGTKGIFSYSASTNDGANNLANAVAIQSNGEIVVAGQIGSHSGLLRLNTNGTLDTSFGSGGTVLTSIGGDIEQVFLGMAIQSDGKIVVLATGCPPRGVVARFETNGSLDTSFGSSGSVSLSLVARGLALQSDGKILITGSNEGVPLMARLLTSGQLDTSFGTSGIAALVAGPGPIALQSNGEILIGSGGLTASPFLNPVPGPGGVARYNTDGSLDTTFGISGQAGSVVAPSAIAVQSNGKIVVAGANPSQLAVTGNSSGFGVIRLNSNGSVDTTFGTRGGAITSYANLPLTGSFAVAIQSNGDVVSAGEAGSTTSNSQIVESFALARYLGTGALDTTFGTGGEVTTSFGSNAQAFISSIALQSNGDIVVAGSNGSSAIEVARYLSQ
jgi:uncharacterized delta-60 repeat protein